MINFDLLVAGCDTRCKHCYVNGGPLKRMDGDDAVLCIEQLDAIAAYLSEKETITGKQFMELYELAVAERGMSSEESNTTTAEVGEKTKGGVTVLTDEDFFDDSPPKWDSGDSDPEAGESETDD